MSSRARCSLACRSLHARTASVRARRKTLTARFSSRPERGEAGKTMSAWVCCWLRWGSGTSEGRSNRPGRRARGRVPDPSFIMPHHSRR